MNDISDRYAAVDAKEEVLRLREIALAARAAELEAMGLKAKERDKGKGNKRYVRTGVFHHYKTAHFILIDPSNHDDRSKTPRANTSPRKTTTPRNSFRPTSSRRSSLASNPHTPRNKAHVSARGGGSDKVASLDPDSDNGTSVAAGSFYAASSYGLRLVADTKALLRIIPLIGSYLSEGGLHPTKGFVPPAIITAFSPSAVTRNTSSKSKLSPSTKSPGTRSSITSIARLSSQDSQSPDNLPTDTTDDASYNSGLVSVTPSAGGTSTLSPVRGRASTTHTAVTSSLISPLSLSSHTRPVSPVSFNFDSLQ